MTTHMIEVINPCARRILVTIPAQDVLHEKKLKIEQLAKHPPKGFRRGSKNTQVYLEKQFSKKEAQGFYQEICRQYMYKILDEEQLLFVLEPTLQAWDLKPDGSLHVTFECEIAPPIENICFEQVTLEKVNIEITEKDSAKSLELVQKNASHLPKEELGSYTEQLVKHFAKEIQEKHLHNQVIEELVKQNPLNDLPVKLVEQRYQALKAQATLHQQNEASFEKTLKETIHFQITAELLLTAYIRIHQLTPETQYIEQKVKQLAVSVRGDQAKLHNLLKNPRVIRTIEQDALRDQVIDALLKQANFTSKTMTYTEAMGWSDEDTTQTTTTSQEEATS